MNEALMAVLHEVLEETAKKMRDAQGDIEKCKGEILSTQQAMKSVEHNLKCKIYEDEQLTVKLEALKTYVSRFDEPLSVLVEKVQKLSAAQQFTSQVRFEADFKMSAAYKDLNNKQTNLAVLEKEYVRLRDQWGKLSEAISQERANGPT